MCQVDGARWSTLEGIARVSRDPDEITESVRRYAARYRQPRESPTRVTISSTSPGCSGTSEPAQHSRPSAGTVPSRKNASTAPSTQALPAPKEVCPSPSRATSTPDSSYSAMATDHSNGVAGSRLVPMTRMGAAPSARISSGSYGDSTGQAPQDRRDHAKSRPNVGEASV